MKYIIFVVPLLFIQSSFSQDIGFMVQTAEILQDYSSSIEFGPSSKVTKKQLEKWVEVNSVSYSSSSSSEIMKGFIKAEYSSRFVYGANHVFARKLTFVKANQYNAYVAFWERQEQLAKEKRERDEIIGTALAIGGGVLLWKAGKAFVKGVGDMLSSNVKSETSNENSSSYHQVLSKTEGTFVAVTKYDIPTKDVNISIGCENYAHEVDKKDDGFYAVFVPEKNKDRTKSTAIDRRVLDDNEIEVSEAPGVLTVSFNSKKDKRVSVSIKINVPGYYRVVIKAPSY